MANSPFQIKAFSQVGPPSLDNYHKLLSNLDRANRAAEAGDDELYVILKCVVSVLHFLDADIIVRGSGITRHLGTLAASLRVRPKSISAFADSS
jgi:hypothetical protein